MSNPYSLGEGEIAPLLPAPLADRELAGLFELLTDRHPTNGIV